MVKKSNFVFLWNILYKNDRVGLYVRDMSKGFIEDNSISENNIEVLFENEIKD